MPLAMRALLLEEAPKNVPFTCHFSRVSFLIFFFFWKEEETMHLGSGRGQHYDLKGLHKRRKRVMVSSPYWGSLRSSCAVLGFFLKAILTCACF